MRFGAVVNLDNLVGVRIGEENQNGKQREQLRLVNL
jgi:hypothetical protein